MLKKIHRHIQKYFRPKDDKNVLLLRLLLLTMVVTIGYMIVTPAKKGVPGSTEKIMLNTKEIAVESTFRMATTHLCAAVLEAKVSSIQQDAIELTFITKQDGTREFVPLNPPETYTIRNGNCIPAHPACDDMTFEYCFTLDTTQKPVKVNYEVRET